MTENNNNKNLCDFVVKNDWFYSLRSIEQVHVIVLGVHVQRGSKLGALQFMVLF